MISNGVGLSSCPVPIHRPKILNKTEDKEGHFNTPHLVVIPINVTNK